MKQYLKQLSILMVSSLLMACTTNPNSSSVSLDASSSTIDQSSQSSSVTSEEESKVVQLETHGEVIQHEFESILEGYSAVNNAVYNDSFYFSIEGGKPNSISYTAREYKLDLNTGNFTLLKEYPQNKVRVSDFIEFDGVLYEAITDLNDYSITFRILADGQEIWTGYGNPEFHVINNELLFTGYLKDGGQTINVVCKVNPDQTTTTLLQSGQDGLGVLFGPLNQTANHSKLLLRSTQEEKEVFVLIDPDGYEIIGLNDWPINYYLLANDIIISYQENDVATSEQANVENIKYKYEAISLSTKETYSVNLTDDQIDYLSFGTAINQSILFNHPQESGVWKGTLNVKFLKIGTNK